MRFNRERVGVKVKADSSRLRRMSSPDVRASRGVYERRVIGQEINSADKVLRISCCLLAASSLHAALGPGSALDPRTFFLD